MNIQRFLSTGNVSAFLQKLPSISEIVSYHPYIERQVLAFCGLHALNHIFQKELFVYIKIDKIFIDDQLNLYAFERVYLNDQKKQMMDAYIDEELNRILRTLKNPKEYPTQPIMPQIPIPPNEPLEPVRPRRQTLRAKAIYNTEMNAFHEATALYKKRTTKVCPRTVILYESSTGSTKKISKPSLYIQQFHTIKKQISRS